MRVLIDCDGVLADFITPMLNLVNKYSGTQHKLSDMREWDMYETFDVPSYIQAMVDTVIDGPGYARSLEVLPGAQEGVELIREIAEVYVVTSPWSSATWAHDRTVWLQRHFGIDDKHVIPTAAKHVCAGDALVDDKTSTLHRWKACHPGGLAVQWDHPMLAHNTSPFYHPKSWSELVEALKTHSGERTWRHA